MAQGKFLTSGHVSLFNANLRSAYKITAFSYNVRKTAGVRGGGR